MMGLIGWSVTIPTLLGAALGLWLDQRYPGGRSWTLALLVVGLAIGCWNAWCWVSREDGGTPPILTRHGCLIVYHGVRELPDAGPGEQPLCYSAGVMVLSKEHPRTIRYRSVEPVLTPLLKEERHGTDQRRVPHRD